MERKTEAKPVHAQHGSCVTTTEWGTCSDVSTDGMGDLETTLDEVPSGFSVRSRPAFSTLPNLPGGFLSCWDAQRRRLLLKNVQGGPDKDLAPLVSVPTAWAAGARTWEAVLPTGPRAGSSLLACWLLGTRNVFF